MAHTPRTRHDLPHAVREVEHLWIPLSDGCRLAARLWLPEGAERRPVPALLEYIPYRKRDGTRWRDEPMHGYFAGHGYASLRVDLRGTGDSDGLLLDEYLPQEQDDALEVLRWVAAQPWCSGRVGMMGKSWGGINALQVAARRPPELGAVISVCSTDDRYADDAHYRGGCLLNDNQVWGSMLLTLAAFPPDPELVGAGWRETWRARLEALPLYPALWLRHQRRDDYWRQGSVCEDHARILVPVLAIGGWADGYSNTVPRLLAGLQGARRGLIGPWGHFYPHNGVPGPAIGFLQEALRWWDRWLLDEPRPEPEQEPFYRAWMQESVPPGPTQGERPGRWVSEDEWPSTRHRERVFGLRGGALVADPIEARSAASVWFRSTQLCGLDGGSWCGFGAAGEHAGDQRADDGRSLSFDSAPLGARLEILGAPTLTLDLTVDRPLAFLVARLNDVAPDGSSGRVTYGILNLAHRNGHARPEPLEPGRRVRVTLSLDHVAHAFPAGHRLRLALSTSYWPLVWPSPEPVTLQVFPDDLRLRLSERPPRATDESLRAFDAPEVGAAGEILDLDEAGVRRTVEHDLREGTVTYTVSTDVAAGGAPALQHIVPIDLVNGHTLEERYTIRAHDPLSARTEVAHQARFQRGDWSVRVESRLALSATRESFHLDARLETFLGEKGQGEAPFLARSWDERIPRDHL